MKGVRERKKQETRKAIIAAAVKLFAEKGFEQTSMDELAREAGVGKGTIYGYFATKSEIFLAYCEAEIDFAFAALDRKRDEDAPLVEQLVALMLGQITYVTGNHEFGRIFVREMLFPGENTRLSSRELDMRYLGKLGDVLGRAQERGELATECDLILMIAQLHALYMMAISVYYQGDLKTLGEAETFLRALILQALHGPAALAESNAAAREGWNVLKQRFLEQRKLDR